MSYEGWRLLIGEKEERDWAGNEYLFRIGKNQRDSDPILRELQSNTPLKKLVNTAVDDNIIRVITFLSYYLINPTFRHDDSDHAGTDFFWFPLDRLTDDRYNELLGDVDDASEEEEEDEEENDGEDSALPDFPIMSTVGEPVIDAAVSEDYLTQADRLSPEKRQEKLQEEIKRRQEELLEEIEAWLEEGMDQERFRDDFSTWAEDMGKLPARFLLGGIYNERSRIEAIHRVFTTMDPLEDPEELNPEVLLQRLAGLTEEHPALINPAIEGFCLDEHDRDCSFHITKHRGYELGDSFTQCEYCGSDLYRVFRAGIDTTVRDAWMMGLLPELVAARIFETCEWTEEVIPHRMVQMKTDDGLTSSVEVDITVHTENDEILFFEVTSQRDALNRVVKKKNKFEENNIHYDGLVQLSLTDNDEFIDFGDQTVAGGAWMISGLEREEFYHDLRDNLGLS